MFRSVLVANRGEIARRVFATARHLGIRTVAVFSEADAGAAHVREADRAVAIGSAAAGESYLVGARIIEAARASGAEAVHPGYGFLAENAEFAEAVLAAGLIWIGPPPAAIRAMGLKDAAKALMQQAGVPVTPGYLGEDQSETALAREAGRIGYPVLIKAVAGGGGKGMRRVDAASGFSDALAAARREAASAFDDDRVLLETYVARPRHIEVQVFGDAHGNVVHLFERDCSLQRRHQKVIEEAPAPGMSAAVRTAVTEMITGLDLVEWQFRVAAGEALPLRQDQIIVTGHAVEARLYAENPMAGFLPSTGVLEVFAAPDTVRVDSAVECGDQVTPHYDPMIAKLIAHAATREAAIAALAQACSEVAVHPVRTNAGFLVRCLETPDFIAGAMDTGLIDRELDALTAAPEPSPEALAAAGRAARAEIDARFGDASPWSGVPGFRLNAPVATGVRLFLGERPVEARMDAPFSRRAHVGGDGEIVVFEDGEAFVFRDAPPERAGDGVDGDGSLRAPMPGKVTQVLAKVGQAVIRGQGLVTLEAMKMEQTLAAPFDGVVDEIGAEPGAQVVEGALLVRLTAASGPD